MGVSSSYAEEFQSLWERPYPLRQLPTFGRAAIAALDDAAGTMEFSRAITKLRLGVDLIEMQVITHCFLVDLASSLI